MRVAPPESSLGTGAAETLDYGYMGTLYDWPDEEDCATGLCDQKVHEALEVYQHAQAISDADGPALSHFYGCYRMDQLRSAGEL